MVLRLSLLLLFLLAIPPFAFGDVHLLAISEYYLQCDDGNTDVQYIEITPVSSGQFFRQCATLQVKRTVAGANVYLADPVFAGRADHQAFSLGQTWLIATPSFQTETGITPDIFIPDGALDPAGGVIRLAADSGCPLANWGTIHEVRYGDQGSDPAPGPHQAANWDDSGHSYSVGGLSPTNFSGATTDSWTCAPVPVEEKTWGRIKALYRN